jgi:hypothetical protein
MKTIVKILPALLTVLFALGSCAEKEIEYNMGDVAAVSELIAPAGTEATLLDSPKDPDDPDYEFTFKWKPVDSEAVRYLIAFSASATGDELFRFAPVDGAVGGSTKITYPVIDKIACEAGIKAGEEGDLYWTVYTIKGNTEVKASAAPKKLPVERTPGIESPLHLFVTGAATEGGTDITKAALFRNDSPNMFVIYTRLTAGQPFIFTNSNFGTGYESYAYSIEDKKYIERGTPMTVETDGVYRVSANIRYNRFTIELIENLRLFYPAGLDVEGVVTTEFPMNYEGGGIWKLEDFRLAFVDNRYSFRAEVSGRPRVWGHAEVDVASPPAVTGGAYYYISDFALGGEYDHAYKLMSALTGVTTDIYVNMSSTTPAPTHTFALAKAADVPPVTGLTAPAADASIDLNETANFNVVFSWAEPVYDKAFPAKYDVVFFEDAEGTTEISSVPASDFGMATEATVGRAILDNAASAVGADIGAEGTIWWSVRTSILDESVPATAAPRKLNVTRITLPNQLYISGAATEQTDVANALKMRKLEDGVFEGYYTFRNNTAGFRLTDGTTGEYATYAYTDGVFMPSASTATIPASVISGVSGTDRQYRINVNFKTNTITTQIIYNVRIHIQGRGTNNSMTYQGNGVWIRSNWGVGTGNDTRYYFRVSYTNANPSSNGNAWTEKWGCSRVDTNPDPTTGNLNTYGGQAYFNVVTYIGADNFRGPGAATNENDWHYAWKLVTGDGLTNTGNKTFTIYMNGGTGTGATTGTITSEVPFHTY